MSNHQVHVRPNPPNHSLHCYNYSLVPRPNPHAGKRVWCTSSDFLGLQDANCHVILIIGMATHCLVCRSLMQQQCGLICAAGVLSHEKSRAMNLIGAPEIRTATSSSPRNRSKYTRPSSPCRGGVWDRDYYNYCQMLKTGWVSDIST